MKTHLAITLVASLFVSASMAEPPAVGTDMSKALHQATKDNKLAFILMGREDCANCQATKTMIKEGKVPVTADTFIMADINVDDARVSAEFERKFKKEKFGNILPYVVITDPKGKALASYSGYKKPEELTAIVQSAKAKVVEKKQ